MHVRTFLIAGGNKTALVWGSTQEDRVHVVKKLLAEVDQVGFINEEDGNRSLTMMGDELCVNASLAYASLLSPNDAFYTSGLKNPVQVSKPMNGTSVLLALPHHQIGSLVLFEGIGFLCTSEKTAISKSILKAHAEEYKLPAFGVVTYAAEKILPVVYVVATDSCITENACGSGSIACSIVTGLNSIRQPTGQDIYIFQTDSRFVVSAKVEELL